MMARQADGLCIECLHDLDDCHHKLRGKVSALDTLDGGSRCKLCGGGIPKQVSKHYAALLEARDALGAVLVEPYTDPRANLEDAQKLARAALESITRATQ